LFCIRGSGIQVNTVDAAVSTVVDRQFVENIPLNGRTLQSLISAVPGVTYVPAGTGNGAGGGLTVNGQRTEENYFTLDGVSLNAGQTFEAGQGTGYGAGYSGSSLNLSALGTTQSLLSLDSLQEFRATTSTYSAEYGRTPGGQFSLTSRSGTNSWHGSGYDYFRNGAMDANNTFNKSATPSVARQAERQNDFGGTLGGPIRIPRLYNGIDKTFFFFSYEGLRLMSPTAAQTYVVPSLSLRQQAPAALQPFLNAYPRPNGTDFGNGFADFTAGYSTPSSIDSTSIRIDHSFTDKFKIFARYSDSPSSTASRSTAGDSPVAILNTYSNNTKTITAGATSQLTSRLNNDLRFGFTKSNWNVGYAYTDFGGATVPNLSSAIPGYTNGTWLSTLVCCGGGGDFGNFLYPNHNSQKQVNVIDTANLSIGRHNLKWGIDYRRTSTEEARPVLEEFAFYFSEAAVLSNTVDYGNIRVTPYSSLNPVYMNFSPFVQDEWRANSRLSISLGLRWELNPAPSDANGNDPYTLTQITNFATTVLAPKGTQLWQTTYTNFAPRVGIAYQLSQAPGHESVLRAGFGKFYDTADAEASIGYNAVGTTASKDASGSSFPYSQNQIASVGPPSTATPYTYQVNSFNPHLKLPYTLQWNVALQQGLGDKQTLSLTYLGAGGRRMLATLYYDPSQVGDPAFSLQNGLTVVTNGSTSNYNALQVQFQRRLSRGLQALASYTWSHSIDDISTNFYSYAKMRASSDFDVRHNLQATITYAIPGVYQNRLVGAVLGQWNIDSRITARSALPVDLLSAVVYSKTTGQQLRYHPNRVVGQPLYVYGSEYPGGRAINYDAFSTATDSSGNSIEGDIGRNYARGFNAVQADVALRKDFRLSERVGLQFRAEAFNVLNQAIFGDIHNFLSNGASQFGRAYDTENTQLGSLNSLYQAGGPRSLQIALRLHF
jgi:hypothetical protein